MSRKRLKHAADVFCKMFCGWRMHASAQRLATLAPGSLEADIQAGTCLFNGQPIETVPIVTEIQHWFQEDIEKHKIRPSLIAKATLRARLSRMDVEGAVIALGNVDSEIIADGRVYKAQMPCRFGWPF